MPAAGRPTRIGPKRSWSEQTLEQIPKYPVKNSTTVALELFDNPEIDVKTPEEWLADAVPYTDIDYWCVQCTLRRSRPSPRPRLTLEQIQETLPPSVFREQGARARGRGQWGTTPAAARGRGRRPGPPGPPTRGAPRARSAAGRPPRPALRCAPGGGGMTRRERTPGRGLVGSGAQGQCRAREPVAVDPSPPPPPPPPMDPRPDPGPPPRQPARGRGRADDRERPHPRCRGRAGPGSPWPWDPRRPPGSDPLTPPAGG